MTQSASWESFQIQIPGQDLLKGVRNVLETLLVFLEIAKAILETIKQFLIFFGNPLIALLEALIALIPDLFKALQQTGVYAYYDLPDPFRDPNFKTLSGGFQAFKTRWKGSLLDQRDSNRPQPVPNLLQGGFFLFVLDADGPLALIQLVKSVLAFFKNPKRFISPQYPPPAHLKAVPLTPQGDPVLSITNLLSTQSTSLAVEWKLPGTVPTGDVGFAGTASQIVQNFRVPNWLIEIATSPPTVPIEITSDPVTGQFDASALHDPNQVGRLVMNYSTPFTDPRNLGNTFNGLAAVTDEYGDPIIKFNYYAVVDGFSAFLQAQLGTVRFVIEDVPLDTNLYIRVRAFFGDLATFPYQDPFVNLNWDNTLTQRMGDGSGQLYLPWPQVGSTQISMGKPSAMIKARITTNPTFDVIGDLTAIFQAGFSLNFHVPLPPGTPEISGGKPVLDNRGNPVYYPQFDSSGNPISPLTVANIGEGTMTDMAGGVAGNIFVSPPAALAYQDYQPDPVTGEVPEQPWQTLPVRFQSTRLAIRFASILMEQGGPVLAAFRELMKGPLPAGSVSISWPQGTPTNLEQLVTYMTTATPVETSPNQNAQIQQALEDAGVNNTTVSFGTAAAYAKAFNDAVTRKNVAAAVEFLRSLNYQGTPPDWISVSLLDIIPWSGQILYDLIAKIQALVDAFQGVLQEIINFINMLERKINALEQFIEYLVSILNFLLNLEVGFYLLPVPSINGDVTAWMSTIDQAGGTIPPSGPSGYTAGICLAYLGPDVSAIASAFALLF
jgi:hypothetical protein